MYLLFKSKFCAGRQAMSMCCNHSNKNGVYFFPKKKKYLKEDISYKIVQGNKRKVEGQFDTMIINV